MHLHRLSLIYNKVLLKFVTLSLITKMDPLMHTLLARKDVRSNETLSAKKQERNRLRVL